MSKKSIEIKTRLKRETVVSYLEELVKSLKAGKLVVQQEEEFVSLHPAAMMELEVSASHKKSKEKFALELSWINEVEGVEPAALLIGTKEPKIAEAPKKPESAAPEAPAKKAPEAPAAKAPAHK